MTGDEELDAMAAVRDALTDLSAEAQERVISWVIKRFDIPITGTSGNRSKGSDGSDDHRDDDNDNGGGNNDNGGGNNDNGDTTEFEHFGELFAKAQPRTEVEKALVAAYWVQVIEGYSQWGARRLSTELKHLGHSLTNISDSLSKNMQKKPQLVIQLRKSGNSKQANKTYKVTDEGVTYVKNMLAGGGS